jgi:lipopolysaccharide/colanic/teichoic acid biosynthesis glycosyltransferase
MPSTPNQKKVHLLLPARGRLLKHVDQMIKRMLQEVCAVPPLLLLVLALLLEGWVLVHADALVEALISVKNLAIT